MVKSEVPNDYSGPDRRKNKIFTTRNTAYYTAAGKCVAVQDVRTGNWLAGHLALGRELLGGVRVTADGSLIPVPARPNVGDALYFADGERELITSVLCQIERTPRELFAMGVPQAWGMTNRPAALRNGRADLLH
jgi:hypothetical protein